VVAQDQQLGVLGVIEQYLIGQADLYTGPYSVGVCGGQGGHGVSRPLPGVSHELLGVDSG
jgi:hypothetical protein